jgi:hypothetical protein
MGFYFTSVSVAVQILYNRPQYHLQFTFRFMDLVVRVVPVDTTYINLLYH